MKKKIVLITIIIAVLYITVSLTSCQRGYGGTLSSEVSSASISSSAVKSTSASSSAAITSSTAASSLVTSSSAVSRSSAVSHEAASSKTAVSSKAAVLTQTPAQPQQQSQPAAPAWPTSGPVPSALSIPDLDGQNVYQNSAAAIDLSYISYGFIKVKLVTPSTLGIKVGVQCGSQTYFYNLRGDGGTEVYPLQMGNGSYSLTVYQNITGNQYATLLSTTVQVTLADPLDPFLVPSQFVNYSDSSLSTTIARSLVSGKTNNYDRISAVLTYVAQNITYDNNEAANVQAGYVPNIDSVLTSKEGICFDYSAVAAAMLRSLGYPTKMIFGYVQNGTAYHAWNEVYIQGQGWLSVMSVTLSTSNWSRVDTTFISTSTSPETVAKYIEDDNNYQTDKTY